jgi:hypothetical protein
MEMSRACLILVAVLSIAGAAPHANALQPTWARKAVAFQSFCNLPSPGEVHEKDDPFSQEHCKPRDIPAPDGKKLLLLRYMKGDAPSDRMLFATLELRNEDGTVREVDGDFGFTDAEVLWSPDSKAFLINYGVGGSTWGSKVDVFRLDDPKLKAIEVTDQVQRDMVKAFPPCKASQLDRDECREMEKDPGYNMSGIDWSDGSSNIVVMAEVPGGGGYGGIRGQVLGYELDVPTGKIVHRMSAREFAKSWQKSMAFRFHIPDPPEYCEPKNPREIPGCIGHNW